MSLHGSDKGGNGPSISEFDNERFLQSFAVWATLHCSVLLDSQSAQDTLLSCDAEWWVNELVSGSLIDCDSLFMQQLFSMCHSEVCGSIYVASIALVPSEGQSSGPSVQDTACATFRYVVTGRRHLSRPLGHPASWMKGVPSGRLDCGLYFIGHFRYFCVHLEHTGHACISRWEIGVSKTTYPR